MQHTLTYQPEWIEMINTLPDTNERNALLAAITMYQYNGQIPELSPTLHLVFLLIKKEIDAITQQIQIAEARKEARRLKRINTPKPSKELTAPKPEQPSEEEDTMLPQSDDDSIRQLIKEAKDEAQREAEISVAQPCNDTINQEPHRKSSSKFNSLIRAKEKHDRNRLKNRSHPRR